MSSKNRTSTRRMHKLRTEFFDEGKALLTDDDPKKRAEASCWLCGMEIDYDVEPNSTPDSHNLDHYYPVRDYPELQEDPVNFRHSHQECNVRRGADAPQPGLGSLSRSWTN